MPTVRLYPRRGLFLRVPPGSSTSVESLPRSGFRRVWPLEVPGAECRGQRAVGGSTPDQDGDRRVDAMTARELECKAGQGRAAPATRRATRMWADGRLDQRHRQD